MKTAINWLLIGRVGATGVACDAVAKKVRRSATATELFSKVRRKVVQNLTIFCPFDAFVFRTTETGKTEFSKAKF